MKYHRCRCGAREAWESGMPPADCSGCEKCGTTLAQSESGHRPLIAHDWEPRFDVRTGLQSGRQCRRCYRTEKVDTPPELRIPLDEGITPAVADQVRKCVTDALPALVSAVREAVRSDLARGRI